MEGRCQNGKLRVPLLELPCKEVALKPIVVVHQISLLVCNLVQKYMMIGRNANSVVANLMTPLMKDMSLYVKRNIKKV